MGVQYLLKEPSLKVKHIALNLVSGNRGQKDVNMFLDSVGEEQELKHFTRVRFKAFTPYYRSPSYLEVGYSGR